MKRFLLLIALIAVIAGGASLRAQDFGDLVSLYDYGFGLDFLKAKSPEFRNQNGEVVVPSIEQSATAYGIWLGFNFPIVQLADDFSAGLSPNATLFAVLPLGSEEEQLYFGEVALGYSVPVMAILKYGTDAYYKGKMKYGFTLGVGYRYTSFLLSSNENDGLISADSFGTPILMGEFNFKLGRKMGLMKLRYVASLGSSEDDNKFEMSSNSFYITYTPNW